jgi:hypothetical protein
VLAAIIAGEDLGADEPAADLSAIDEQVFVRIS